MQDNEQRAFMRRLITDIPAGQHALILRYLTFFKPAKNAMSFKTLNTRLDSLLAMIKSAKVTRNSETKVAPPKVWYEAMTELTTNKPDTLSLPLRNHNYLSSIVWRHGEKAAAYTEANIEQQRKDRQRSFEDGQSGMQDVINALKPNRKR
jgi:hypothetical protein